jgi:hypothetical protein
VEPRDRVGNSLKHVFLGHVLGRQHLGLYKLFASERPLINVNLGADLVLMREEVDLVLHQSVYKQPLALFVELADDYFLGQYSVLAAEERLVGDPCQPLEFQFLGRHRLPLFEGFHYCLSKF